MKYIKITKNWFFSAGAKYGWVKDNFDIKGVGIRMSDIKTNKNIRIEINGEDYVMDCEESLKFIDTYKSVFITGSSTEIGVVSKSLLRQLLRMPNEEVVEPIQNTREPLKFDIKKYRPEFMKNKDDQQKND
jgi:nitroimidazol reductase NimA-like FMN-containing flavoprotein (pyridoxamine 5'-phosphate oxidase superfamily)